MTRQKKKDSLTDKEEQLMHLFWAHGPLFVKQLVELLPDPKPHFNTVSTFVRILEKKASCRTMNSAAHISITQWLAWKTSAVKDSVIS